MAVEELALTETKRTTIVLSESGMLGENEKPGEEGPTAVNGEELRQLDESVEPAATEEQAEETDPEDQAEETDPEDQAEETEAQAQPQESTPSNERTRVADPVERYLADIRRYAILDRDSELVLTRKYVETHDPRIAVRLVTSNLRLVVKIALEYQSSPWTDLLDIIQEGNLGLLQAVRKFDPERKIRLSSYAQWWIRAYILKYLMDNHRLVKVGTTQAQRKLFYNLQRERERLERQGFRPTPRLLAKALCVRVKDIVEMETRLAMKEVSIEAPLIDRERDRLVDLLPSDQPAIDDILSQQEVSRHLLERLEDFSSTLSGRELEIWVRRLMSDRPITLQALGRLFGVSRERARQLEARVMKKLRRHLGGDHSLLDDFNFPLTDEEE